MIVLEGFAFGVDWWLAFPFDEGVVLVTVLLEERVLELMDVVVVEFGFDEVVEVELSEEGAVVVVSEVLGEESATELIGSVHHKGRIALSPPDQVLMLLVLKHVG